MVDLWAFVAFCGKFHGFMEIGTMAAIEMVTMNDTTQGGTTNGHVIYYSGGMHATKYV